MNVLAELRVAVRALQRAPGLLTVAVLTLALGLGANTILFSPLDIPSFALAVTLLLLTALLVCLIPARRAAMVDPAKVLRCE